MDLYALAPDHIGATTYENPTLYWYQSATTDAKIEIGINRDDAVDPILQAQFNKQKGPRIHKIELAQYNVKIEKTSNMNGLLPLWETVKIIQKILLQAAH